MKGLENYYHLLNAARMGVGRKNFNIIVKIDRLYSLTQLTDFFKKTARISLIYLRALLLDKKRNLYLC